MNRKRGQDVAAVKRGVIRKQETGNDRRFRWPRSYYAARPSGLARSRHARKACRVNNCGSRPVSRVLSGTVIHLGPVSPPASSGLPGRGAGHAIASLFGLAPGGVCPAIPVAGNAVRSYRTISPLPVPLRVIGGVFSVALSVGLIASQALPGTLPFGARTFLHVPLERHTATVQPAPAGIMTPAGLAGCHPTPATSALPSG